MENKVDYKNISIEIKQKNSSSKENLILALYSMTSFVELDTTTCDKLINVTYEVIKGTVVVKDILKNNAILFSEVKSSDIDIYLSKDVVRKANNKIIDKRVKIVNELIELNIDSKDEALELFYSKYYDFLTAKGNENDFMLNTMMRMSRVVHDVLIRK